MNIILDIILLVIVALSIWYGYKRGLIGSILSILAIIVALIAGSSLSANYAFEAVPVLEPFLNGYVDSQKTRDTVLEKMGYGNTDLSLDDVLASDSSLRYDYAVLCMEELGFHEDRAEELAERAVRYADQNDVSMPDAVITILCDTITYVAGLTICFLLILIILVAISNIGNLVIRLYMLFLWFGLRGIYSLCSRAVTTHWDTSILKATRCPSFSCRIVEHPPDNQKRQQSLES